MRSIQRHHISLLATLAYCVLVLPLNERLAFTIPGDRKGLVISYALKLLFAFFLYFLIYFAIGFVQKVRSGDHEYRLWLTYAGIYFGVLSVLLVLIYPGHWVLDELIILNGVKEYSLFSWQNYFTNIYYTLCMYLIPSGISIVLFQMAFCSLVVGYVTTKARRFFTNKHLANGLFLLFFLPPILINDLYPLRITMYTYIELLVVVKLLLLHKDKFQVRNRYWELIAFAVLITLLSFWRTEGLYYLILFPVMLWLLGFIKWRSIKDPLAYVAIGVGTFIILMGYQITAYVREDQYEITAFINPLSIMAQQPLRGDNLEARWAVIDKVVNLEVLKKYPSTEEIPSYWNGAVRPTFKEHYPEFKRQYFYLVKHNPDVFLRARAQTFMATNGFGNNPVLNVGLINQKGHLPVDQERIVQRFENTNYFTSPLSPRIKLHVTEILMQRRAEGRMHILGRPLWNVMAPITALIIVAVAMVIKKKYFWALLALLVLAKVPIIFLTAPANYFMYYLPVYVTGYFLFCFVALLFVDKSRHRVFRKK